MKVFVLLLSLVLCSFAYAQSGRRAKEAKFPVPPPEQATEPTPHAPVPVEPPPVTAEKNEEYRCMDDDTLGRILDNDIVDEPVLPAKAVDEKAVITAKPKPSYTKEARRNGIQGFVTLKILLSAQGKITRIKVLKGLPAGLTENGMRAACKMTFKPAVKDGRPVAVWLTAEYIFRLADSSIFTP